MRSYVTGAAHMGLGWVCSEGIAVGEDGVPDDLTIRSFGILPARATPPISVHLEAGVGDGRRAGPRFRRRLRRGGCGDMDRPGPAGPLADPTWSGQHEEPA